MTSSSPGSDCSFHHSPKTRPDPEKTSAERMSAPALLLWPLGLFSGPWELSVNLSSLASVLPRASQSLQAYGLCSRTPSIPASRSLFQCSSFKMCPLSLIKPIFKERCKETEPPVTLRRTVTIAQEEVPLGRACGSSPGHCWTAAPHPLPTLGPWKPAPRSLEVIDWALQTFSNQFFKTIPRFFSAHLAPFVP